MRLTTCVLRRLAALIPQLLCVSVVAFLLMRLLPGNPAAVILGPTISPEGIEAVEASFGLDKPLHIQYVIYLQNVLQGDLGRSWFTSEPVLQDLVNRAPATLELIGYTMTVALLGGIALGTIAASSERTPIARVIRMCIRLAGSFPEFWIALMAIYVFFYRLRWFPAPLGRLDIETTPPTRITGLYTVDSLLTGNVSTFTASLAHLALPVLTLGIILALAVARVTETNMRAALHSDYIRYARAAGLGRVLVFRYALRNALPPVVALGGTIFSFLLGGIVLMEQVFSWGGVGQYAVQAVENADFLPVQGFLLLSATFTMVVFLVVDIIHMILDPRVRS